MHTTDWSCRYYIQDVFFWRLAGPVSSTGKAIVHWIGIFQLCSNVLYLLGLVDGIRGADVSETKIEEVSEDLLSVLSDISTLDGKSDAQNKILPKVIIHFKMMVIGNLMFIYMFVYCSMLQKWCIN